MEINPQFMPKVLKIYLEISQYPILSRIIRERMRWEIFQRGIVSPESFEREIREKAIESQKREGLQNPYREESPHDWNERMNTIRAYMTDFYFAYNLPHNLFEQIVQDVINERVPDREVRLSFNPELAPWDVLFTEGEHYEQMPADEQTRVKHHLREIKVVLIKAMISDHLTFVGLAREAFSIEDLKMIRDNRIGRGKIGGKAAGMLLAYRLLQNHATEWGLDPEAITIPPSYYIASDVFYDVHEINDFYPFMNQKYRTQDEIFADYPKIFKRYLDARLPDYVAQHLAELLDKIGPRPLIFRSSSLLEDSFDTSFAGKYDSFFLPNQGTPEENFAAAREALLRIYASTLSPDALIYRKHMNLIDFDERMAILIQIVEGEHYGHYYFPAMAGVGFSRNPFRWNARIRREDGLLRLVAGLGTRAVDRVANDYPRMVALSHPRLRPETNVAQVRQYSQRLIDVLNCENNAFETLPITTILDSKYPALRLLAVQDMGDHLQPFAMRPTNVDPAQLVFTFDRLLDRTTFPETMRKVLACLQEHYKRPVDIEYTVKIGQTWPEVRFSIALLQCRPLSQHDHQVNPPIPEDIPEPDKLFTAQRQVPEGVIEDVRYIVFVTPAYNDIADPGRRLEVGRVVSRLNERLDGEQFILMGPGRWGSSNSLLGVKVTYADIYNSRALIEVALPNQGGNTPEMAYGTHFFQDLVEAKIYPLALFPDDCEMCFNWDYFMGSTNVLPDLLPGDADLADIVRVIDVPAVSDGRLLEIIMNPVQDMALGYLRHYGTDDGSSNDEG